jgi:hypothetical protein
LDDAVAGADTGQQDEFHEDPGWLVAEIYPDIFRKPSK